MTPKSSQTNWHLIYHLHITKLFYFLNQNTMFIIDNKTLTSKLYIVSITKNLSIHHSPYWGRNSSLVVFGLAVHSVAGSILLWGNFPVEGIFSLGVNMGSNSIPPKTLSDESINRGLVCAHMHFIARTQKILTFMS